MIAVVSNNTTRLAELCKQHGVCRLELFGSAARGDFENHTSDIDFLVEFEPRATGQFDAYFSLKEDLEALFGRPVDLVVSSAIRNQYFLEAVNRSREVVYGN